jgi:hypothetical protein
MAASKKPTPEELKEMRIEFAPGVLEQMEQDMTPAEMQEFMDMLKAKIEDGSLFEESTPVDMEELAEDDPEAYEQMVQAMEWSANEFPPRKLH